MNSKVAWIGVSVASLAFCGVASARPSFSTNTQNSCSVSGCHSSVAPPRMEVTDEDSTDDLGTQLDGKTRGPLKTFVVDPGASGRGYDLKSMV